jgi:hypothetical protein
MLYSSLSFSRVFQAGLRGFLSLAFLSSGVTANEPFLNKPSEEWTEAEALQVLNNSQWAHTITTTTLDFQCDYEHPAFPGMFPEQRAQQLDSLSPQSQAEPVTPDYAEYVVRLNSVKPMQAAAERLIQISAKYASYAEGYGLEPGSKPTSVADHFYNLADLLTFSVILKHTGPSGESFRDFAFPERKVRHIWACSGIRTANGQYDGVVAKSTGPEHLEARRGNRDKHFISSYCGWKAADNSA